MNMTARDKKVLIGGAVAAVAIFIVGYVVIPAVRNWSDSQASLSSQQEHVAELQDRISSQGTLVKQRNALVRRLGSLFEAPPDAPKKDEKEPNEAKETWFAKESPKADPTPPEGQKPPKEEAVKPEGPEEKKPEAREDAKPDEKKDEPQKEALDDAKPEEKKEEAKPDAESGDKKEEKKPEEGPAAGATLAGYVEQQARKAEVTVKSITPAKTSSGLKGVKQYRPVMLQVKIQCKAKGLVTLLGSLENGERFVKVEQVQVHRDLSKDEINVTLDVRSYESVARPS